MQRRELTCRPIELGGLVQRAGLVEFTADDRATIYGVLLDLAARAKVEEADAERDELLALWKRRGRRAFDTEGEQS